MQKTDDRELQHRVDQATRAAFDGFLVQVSRAVSQVLADQKSEYHASAVELRAELAEAKEERVEAHRENFLIKDRLRRLERRAEDADLVAQAADKAKLDLMEDNQRLRAELDSLRNPPPPILKLAPPAKTWTNCAAKEGMST